MLIAQIFTDSQDPTGFLTAALPLLAGFVIPMIVARITKAETAGRVKMYVSLAIALIAAATPLFVGQDWSADNVGAALARLAAMFAEAQIAYVELNRYFERRSLREAVIPRGLNEQAWAKPESGI